MMLRRGSLVMEVTMLVALALVSALGSGEGAYIAYNTSQGIVEGKINVHLVAHTHDDVGWLKTVDQYYVGSNNSIQGACVQNVLDSVISALLADKNRKFIYRWWRNQSPMVQKIVKELVDSGQLEFINGGMCMHDEAAPHYIDMIDQTTLGHRFIKEEFGKTPRIGWQIDPFGHSAVQAYLLSAEVGFDSFFFARIDYQDRQKRKDDKNLEFVWQGSRTLGSSSQIFAGAFPNGNYEPPRGFYFEVNDDSPLVQDDVLLYDYNVQERVDDFVSAAISQANVTRTNHIMWTMGTDFKYQYARTWFRQMDKLIHYVNKDGRVNALYSTPSIYTDAKHAANESWPLKTDDFFPYADRANAYWTGYFTSRPAFKRYVRTLSGYYLAARQLEFLKGRSDSGPNTDALADALAIAQHHDGVTGTEKQHVADDYAKRLAIGYTEAEQLVSEVLACLAEGKLNASCRNVSTKFEQCPLLNISYCPPSEANLHLNKRLVLIVYNSLGWKRVDIVQIPVSSNSVVVRDSDGKEIESQIWPLSSPSIRIRNFYARAHAGVSSSNAPRFWLAFTVSVPPLGFNTYTVEDVGGQSKHEGGMSNFSSVFVQEDADTIEVGQGNLRFIYSADGKLSRILNKKNTVDMLVQQSYTVYRSYNGSESDPQASGAYIFRPNGTIPTGTAGRIQLTVVRGPIVEEVHQEFNTWISQITRIYKGKEHAEVEFIIGPVPVDDQVGKEIATQLTASMMTNKTFYTDSNGRDFIKRIRDYRADWDLEVNQPIAGNYYPINLGMYMVDRNFELSVLVDRAVGGASVADGQMELMLHRRLLHDDSRGVAESLNEVICVPGECEGLTIQGKFYIRIDPLGGGAKWRRSAGQEIYSPLLLAFAEQDKVEMGSPLIRTFSKTSTSYSLPDNVAVITLQELKDGSTLLRLAHLYEMGEDKDLSTMASVDLKKLFEGRKINKITEMNLSANQERATMEKKRLVWKVEGAPLPETVLRGRPVDPVQLIVELGPMEIRTFVLLFDHVFLYTDDSMR
ncbi:Alpha-mannosidase [Nymphaea thermarum]|nr:Alpha-mannosidase [Nymphaea thermarum]